MKHPHDHKHEEKHNHNHEEIHAEEQMMEMPMGEMNDEESKTKKVDGIVLSKKKIVTAVLAIALIAVAYYGKGLVIAATVDGSPISRLSVIHSLEKNTGKQALNTLITKQLIENEVRKNNIVVTDEDVEMGIKYISEQIEAQGVTLETALSSQGVSYEEFKKNQRTQIQVEKLLGDKISVTDAEVDAYLKSNKLEIPADQLVLTKTTIKDQLKREKLNAEGQIFVDGLRAKAKISYFVEY